MNEPQPPAADPAEEHLTPGANPAVEESPAPEQVDPDEAPQGPGALED